MRNVGILGAGTWGTALARILSNSGNIVTVWSINREEVKTLAETRRHKNLPNCDIPEEIQFTNDIETACKGKDFLIFAVPSIHVRSTAAAARAFTRSNNCGCLEGH